LNEHLKGTRIMAAPRLLWDWGTAYDFFVSLEVLHRPAEFGVRGAWTAGVRARLPAAQREMLEQGQRLIHIPLHWIHTLPDPKEAITVLSSLGQVARAERLPLLALCPDTPEGLVDTLRDVAARGTWNGEDRERLRSVYLCGEAEPPLSEGLDSTLGWWARAEEFGERYLEALGTYQHVFFAEEEGRIRPALQDALARAQALADQLDLPELLEELSQGLRLTALPEEVEFVLAPSFWSTPLVVFGKVDRERALWLFGARPSDASLVPGETVPDAMLRSLKALSDPTRLRILNLVSQEPLSPAQLARRLRLRAPTVTHHLKALRLTGLVQLTVGEGKDEGRYAARSAAVTATFASLGRFLDTGGGKEP
jgi:DNA-binding transcriptional ArsR family regulator